MIKFILMDIEGTTTDIEFVHKVLFPYASKNLPLFIRNHSSDDAVKNCLKDAAEQMNKPYESVDSLETIIKGLLEWIKADLKQPALKKLQGMVWQNGYESGSFTAHIYDDVLPMWQQWINSDIGLGIFSSGSVKAQKLLFSHTPFGDITPYLSAYFDTTIGSKKMNESYQKIASTLNLAPWEILFLSDIEAELSAAEAAKMNAIQVVRPKTKPSNDHVHVTNFKEIPGSLNISD